MSRTRRILVIGAGAGGLAAAMDLSAAGAAVTVIDRAEEVGGKMRQLPVNGRGIDAGPTVFTMRWVFEDLFSRAGASLSSELTLTGAERLARHAWLDGSQLDLWADIDQSASAIEAFSDTRNADGYRAFCDDSRDIFQTLRAPFMAAQKPSPLGLSRGIGLHRLDKLWRTRPFDRYGSRLKRYFSDPRLQQLFGRYATYIGSSPYLTPATLMLIAHVEQDGVWLVEGGMRAVARAMQTVAARQGTSFRLGTGARSIDIAGGHVAGVTLETGEYLPADAVVFNGDQSALASGLLGPAVVSAGKRTAPAARSLSALTWCMNAKTSGFDLDYHTVFFSDAYQAEFRTIFDDRRLPAQPTIYICAQDRVGPDRPTDRERLLILINAPADGDRASMGDDQLVRLRAQTEDYLARFGLTLEADAPALTTQPSGFHDLFPGTGGALYGRANHSPFATFARQGARSAVKGLYLAGGSVHPGAGVPMATLSGCLAAEAVLTAR